MIRSLTCFRNQYLVCLSLLTAAVILAQVSPVHAQRLSRSYLKNGSSVRYAFRNVVTESRKSTVQIFSDDKQVALGTVVDSDGYVLTKASELTGEIECRFGFNLRLEAEVVGIEHEYDLAMLKVDAEDLQAIKWAEEDNVEVGQFVATPGLGDIPVAVGVVSVPPRKIRAPRGVLGISIADADADSGAKVTQVYENSGAEEAGVQVGDIIMRVSGVTVKDGNTLAATIGGFRPGDTLRLLILRGESELEVRARLGSQFRPEPDRGSLQNRMGGLLSARRGGFPLAMQHDTVLKPDQCGGPIVNLDGYAVGVNIARSGRVESYAIPSAQVLALLEELKSGRLAPPSNRDPLEVADE